MARKGAARAKPKKRRVPRKRAARSAGIEARDCRAEVSGELKAVAARVEEKGGMVVAPYREPLGGHPLLLAVLPVESIEPTPYQRDLSDTHQKRLADVIDKTGRFLDPVIAVPAPEGGFWTPNGLHRLSAMRRLGARSITALVLPDPETARLILALNTEKAHNLKERATEVIRIYRGLAAEEPSRGESEFAFYLEDPSLVTLGAAYERRPRLGGGAYHPVLRRVEAFRETPVGEAIKDHERLAAAVLELDDKVAAAVAKLKERGLESPYLRAFVVARINPLRWIQGDPPPAESVLRTMTERAARFNADKVSQKDLAGGFAPAGEEE